MKKFLLVAACALSMTFTACSDDDDEGGSSSSPNQDVVSIITTDDGDKVLLTSINGFDNITFQYDDQGRCTYVTQADDYSYDYLVYNISYDPFSFSYGYEGDSYGEYDGEYYDLNLSFTSEGYIKSIRADYDDYKLETGSGTINFSYDSDGHLTKISYGSSGKHTEDGETVSYTASCSETLSWSNGNLTEVTCSVKVTEGSYYTWTEDKTYTITTGSTANKYNQYSMAEKECMFCALDDDLTLTAHIGMFGKASNYLPESYTYTYHAEDDYGYESSYTLNYTLNSDGTIESETLMEESWIHTTYNYNYTTLGSSSSSEAAYTRAVNSTTENTTEKKRFSWRNFSKRAKRLSDE